jgi:hypothetical protein
MKARRNKMRLNRTWLRPILRSMSLGALVFFSVATAHAQSVDELHKTALTEGGKLNFYGTLAQINAQTILPAFEKRFPGIKVDHIDATADKLVTRAVTEARGGRYIADVFQFNLENLGQRTNKDSLPSECPRKRRLSFEPQGAVLCRDRPPVHHRRVEHQPRQKRRGAETV